MARVPQFKRYSRRHKELGSSYVIARPESTTALRRFFCRGFNRSRAATADRSVNVGGHLSAMRRGRGVKKARANANWCYWLGVTRCVDASSCVAASVYLPALSKFAAMRGKIDVPTCQITVYINALRQRLRVENWGCDDCLEKLVEAWCSENFM